MKRFLIVPLAAVVVGGSALSSTTLVAQQIGVAKLDPQLLKASVVIERRENGDYRPIGSGVLTSASNRVYLITANHVVPADGDVYFRFPDKDTSKAFHHHSHFSSTNMTYLGWVRSEADDLALTQITYTGEYDIKAIPLTELAAFEDVSVGDDVFVIGCPIMPKKTKELVKRAFWLACEGPIHQRAREQRPPFRPTSSRR